MKARPPPIEPAFRLVTVNEKNVEKGIRVWVTGWRKRIGLENRARPAPEVGTGKSRERWMLPLLQCASPMSFKFFKVSVAKSNLTEIDGVRKRRKIRGNLNGCIAC